MSESQILLFCWFAVILLWPPLLTFILSPFHARFDELLIDEVRARIGTAFHELAHAIVGLPFLIIPYKINLWDDNNSDTRGYVKQLSFTLLPFFGFYFSSLAPVLTSLVLVLFSIKWIAGNSLTWFLFSDFSYTHAVDTNTGYLLSFLSNQAFLTAKGITFALFNAWYLALPIAFFLGIFIKSMFPSNVDLKGGAIGFLVWLIVAGFLLFFFDGKLLKGISLDVTYTQILANISVLEIVASFFAFIFLVIHEVIFRLLRSIIVRSSY